MKKVIITLSCLLAASALQVMACTNFIVGKKASTDGSTMVTYSADSHTLYGALYHFPATTYPEGAMLNIREWDTGKPLGKIPQVRKTYNVVGNMNEHQLTIAETTFGGREELHDSTGIMDYGSLIYVTLQRAKTAREAIKIMTDLVKDYGYYSSGESFSIVDPNEAWIMEMIGKGPRNKGAVWVAVRSPDDCVASHANQARIRQFPLNDKENCLYAPDVISFAREKGYFNGLNKDFSFADAYAPLDFGALRFCEARVWSFYRMMDPEMDKYKSYIKGETKEAMPLYIKPRNKVSLKDLMEGMRDHYEGTEFDMTQDVGAGPYKVPYRWRPMTYKVDGETYLNERAIATQQTGFTFVAQMRNWLPNPIGGVLWFGTDDAALCVYTPMYCSVTKVPECYREGNGDMLNFSWTSTFWIYNWVSNMVYHKWNMMYPDVKALQTQMEDHFIQMEPSIDKNALDLYKESPEKAIEFLTNYSDTQAEQATRRWKQLGEFLLVKFIDGNIKQEKNGQFIENGHGLPATPKSAGYSEDYYRNVVKDTGDRLKVTF
ncbi:MAG: C69 family dipeptidase [Bacteroidales bacterium]